MDTWLNREVRRRDVYRLLSACYLPPESGTFDRLGELRTVLSVLCPQAAQQMFSTSRQKLPTEELKVDHARLFVGPYQLLAPPYGSVYLDGQGRRLIGESTLDVKRRYRQAGLGTGEDLKEAPDHVAVELEFLYYLVCKELQALANAEFEHTLDCLNTQQSFLQAHLGAWVARFAHAVEESATTGFYRDLARATREFVYQDRDAIPTASIPGLNALIDTGADGQLG